MYIIELGGIIGIRCIYNPRVIKRCKNEVLTLITIFSNEVIYMGGTNQLGTNTRHHDKKLN
jgi:hypothetical protein